MSEIATLADRLAIIDVITKMFVYTDQKRWEDLSAEVFTATVDFDGGFGGPVGERAAADIIADWRTGLADLDGVHHQSGNHLIDLDGDTARVHADAIAVHVKNAATEGKTRTFVGSYSLGVERTAQGWRVNRFHYHLEVIDGNADLV
ncbi:nuclear transport factor 2 family protein [Nocardia implantans]|uniref:Nuclear transport factor 2 family protein n=1 Tax=Nocardia implantans TaxID=3108168 RepID=A0ABU6AV08_9NOCA|nr:MULTISPECIES: nuclear transport factor 2 family protein [unclassified Nocardia]MBF6192485.1 nuclear transport factor 2 family protein [Nocardia beijingensis]MEA3527610.1 nuclear transport factor 2 family protein [Nocardia sp. CDC192]MEB3511318.1 nuclear transport factor 2 family protein [Nocardia sp. CDC186]